MQAILHCDENWGIGKKNDLMFRLPKDMKFFRKTTTSKVVVMGSNTLLSFPDSKPLKNRTNIVLWPGGPTEKAERDGFIMAQNLDELLKILANYPSQDIFVIGGAMMYRTLLPYCDKVLLTKVQANGNAEVFFPNLDEMPNWTMVQESQPIEDNGYIIKFTTYQNNAPKTLPNEEHGDIDV